jgi:hypothetical protein
MNMSERLPRHRDLIEEAVRASEAEAEFAYRLSNAQQPESPEQVEMSIDEFQIWRTRMTIEGDIQHIRPLSLCARIAIALHLFRGYCNQIGLNHPEIDRFVEHLWEFIALPPDGFDSWEKRQPSLTFVGLGDDFEVDFRSVLISAGVSVASFRRALSCTTEVLYTSMYAAANEYDSRSFLLELAIIVEAVGVQWPDMKCFANSDWADGHGWGNRPTEKELAEWRSAGRM